MNSETLGMANSILILTGTLSNISPIATPIEIKQNTE